MNAKPTLRSAVVLPLVFVAGLGAGRYGWPTADGGSDGSKISGQPGTAPVEVSGSGLLNSGSAGSRSGNTAQKTAAAPVPDFKGLSPAEIKARLEAITDPAVRAAALRQCLAAIPRDEWSGWIESFFGKEQRKPAKIDFRAQANRYGWLDDLFTAITAVDPVGFMDAQNSEGQRNNDSEAEKRVLVMAKWAETNPEAAKSYLVAQLATNRPAPGLSDSVREMAAVLSRNGNAAGVIDWATTLPDKERAAATSAALGELATRDPKAAAQLLVKLKDLPELNARTLRLNTGNLAEEITSNLARTAPDEALAWAAAQTGAMREKGLHGALKDWAARDFDAALAAVRGLNTEAQTTGLSVILDKTQPARLSEMAGLIENQPDNPERAAASARVMSAWTQHSPEQASAWMARQPAGEIRDSAISAFVRWADVRDPEAGLLWAGSMSDPAKRMDAITHIIQQLGPKAPAAVQPWLNTTPALTETERAQVLEKLATGR